MSLANASRWDVVQEDAPDLGRLKSAWITKPRHDEPRRERDSRTSELTIQAFFKGTMWSMSTSAAAVQVAPSYGLNQVPLVAVQAELVTTPVPSRFKIYSLAVAVASEVSQTWQCEATGRT